MPEELGEFRPALKPALQNLKDALESPLPEEMLPVFEIFFIVASSVIFISLIKDLNDYNKRYLENLVESDPKLQAKVDASLKKSRNAKFLFCTILIVTCIWMFWPHLRAVGL